MGFNLRQKLEETFADINPFDNGATAQTVRANRAKAAPAQTVKTQTQNRPMFQQNNQPAFTQQKQFKIQTQSPTINVNNSMPKVQTFGQSSDPLKVGQVKSPQLEQPTIQAPKVYTPEAQQAYIDAKIIGTGNAAQVKQVAKGMQDRSRQKQNDVRLDVMGNRNTSEILKEYNSASVEKQREIMSTLKSEINTARGGNDLDSARAEQQRSYVLSSLTRDGKPKTGNVVTAAQDFVNGTKEMFTDTGNTLARGLSVATGVNRNSANLMIERANQEEDMASSLYKRGAISREQLQYEVAQADQKRYLAQRMLNRDIADSDPLKMGGAVANAGFLPIAFAAGAGSTGAAVGVGAKVVGTSGIVRATNPIGRIGQVLSTNVGKTGTSALTSTPTQLAGRLAPNLSTNSTNLVGAIGENVLSGQPQALSEVMMQKGGDATLGDYATASLMDATASAALPLAGAGGGYLLKKGVNVVDNATHTRLIKSDPIYKANTDKLTAVDATIARAQANGDIRALEGLQAVKAQLSDSNALIARRYSENGFLGGKNATGFNEAKQKGLVFDGVDGKPRFEVDDSGAKLKKDSFTNERLADALDHPELFRQYPALKDLRVVSQPQFRKTHNNASYDRGANAIAVNPDHMRTGNALKSTLLHEIQHAVQTNEQFARGGDLESAMGAILEARDKNRSELSEFFAKHRDKAGNVPEQHRERLRQLQSEQQRLMEIEAMARHTDGRYAYDRLAGEAEARAVQARMNMPMSERYVKYGDELPLSMFEKESAPWAKVTDGKIAYHHRDVLEDSPGKIKRNYWTKKIAQGDRPPVTVEMYDGQLRVRDGNHRLNAYVENKAENAPVKLDADARKNLPSRSTFYDSLDVPKQDLIIRNEGGKAMSIDDPTAALKQEAKPSYIGKVFKRKDGKTNIQLDGKLRTFDEYTDSFGNKKTRMKNAAGDSKSVDGWVSDGSWNIKDGGQGEIAWLNQRITEEPSMGVKQDLARQRYQLEQKLAAPQPTAPVQKPKPVDPTAALKQEALKYKSADEYLQALADRYQEATNTIHPDKVPQEIKALEDLHAGVSLYDSLPANKEAIKKYTDLYNQAHAQPTPKVEATQPTVAPKGAPIEKTNVLRDVPIADFKKTDITSWNEAVQNVSKGKFSKTNGPAEVVLTNNGYKLVEGNHRAVQALNKGDATIKAKVISKEGLDEIAKRDGPHIKMGMQDAYTQKQLDAHFSKSGAPIEKTPQVGKPDPTAALKQEALKYKSADEYLQALADRYQEATNTIHPDKVPQEIKALEDLHAGVSLYDSLPANKEAIKKYTDLYNQAHAKPTPKPKQPTPFEQDLQTAGLKPKTINKPNVEADKINQQLKAMSDSPEFQEFYNGGKITGKSWNEYQRLSKEYRQLLDGAKDQPAGSMKPSKRDLRDYAKMATPGTASTARQSARSRQQKPGLSTNPQPDLPQSKQLSSLQQKLGSAEPTPDSPVNESITSLDSTTKPQVNQVKVKQAGREKNVPVMKQTRDGDVITATNVNDKIKVGEKRYSVDEDGKLIEDKKGATSLFTDEEGRVTGFRVGKEYFDVKDLGDLTSVNGYGSTLATMRRNVERAFDKKTGDKVSAFLVDHQQGQATKLIQRQVEMKQGMQSLADDLGINFASGTKRAKKVSAAIQDFGEGKRNRASLVAEYGNQTADKIIAADKWFRKNYDALLDEMNSTLKQFGYDPVPKRANYYTHFQDEGLWQKFGLKMQEIRDLSSPTMQDANPTGGRGSISNKLAGMSENTSPNKAFNKFALQRKGNKHTSDAFKAFELYLNPTLNNIYMTPSISRARVLSRAIAQDADIVGKDANKTIVQIREWANSLAGKSSRIGDRQLADTMAGPHILKALGWAQKKTGQNTIVGNLSTAVMQPIVLAQTAGKFGYKNTLAGLYQQASGALNSAQAQSGFLKRRYTDVTPVTAGKLDRGAKVANKPLEIVEENAVRSTWNAAHNDAVSQGMTGRKAIQYADVQTEKTVAGRSIGERPEVFRAKSAGLATMFQLEVNNFWQQTGKEMNKSQVAKTMVAMYGLNLGLQALTGRQVGFNPIDAAIDSYDEATKERPGEENSALERSKRIGQRWTGEFVDNAPFIGMAANTAFGEEKVKEWTGDNSNTGRFGASSPIRTLLDNPWMAVSPFGGGQIKKTVEAVPVLVEGKLKDKDGNTLVNVPQTPENIAKGLAFGKGSIPEVNQYYDNLGKSKVDQKLVKNQSVSKAGSMSLDGLTKEQQTMLSTAREDMKPSLIEQYRKDNKAGYTAEKSGTKAPAKKSTAKPLPANMSSTAKSILESYNSMSAEDKKKWDKTTATGNTARTALNSWLGGKAEVPKISNEIARDWANYEKGIKDGSINVLEKDTKKKEILRKAYNEQLSDVEKTMYKLSKADIQRYAESGDITEANLNNALAVEKQLFDAGLISKETLANKLGVSARGYKGKTGRKSSGKGRKVAKGKFDYKLNGFGTSNTSNSKQLHDLLKKATMRVSA